ncbi:MAG: hypothetical protein JNL60_12345 [Bacteroidia bacterium]|nr:hypothetical protein [Bacteroidia bacterium]
MNTAHLHLLLNHTPIIGVFIGTLILIAGFIFSGHPVVKKISLTVIIFAALFSVPAYLSGESAEEVVERLPGVTEAQIEDHEDSGKVFLIFSGILGLFSLFTLISDVRSKNTKFLYIVVLILSIITFGLGIQTGLSGGKVRHTEIRSDYSPQNQEIKKETDSEED